jgi:hypothetical protein
VRFYFTTTQLPETPSHEWRGVTPLPYGGSDRSVVLRSLPLGTLHTLLLVACTMVFFVTLASARAGESGASAVRTVALHPPMISSGCQRSASHYAFVGKSRRNSLVGAPADAHANVSVLDTQNFQASAALTGRRREMIHLPMISAFHVRGMGLTCPTAAVKAVRMTPSDPSSLQSANLPRLS